MILNIISKITLRTLMLLLAGNVIGGAVGITIGVAMAAEDIEKRDVKFCETISEFLISHYPKKQS